LPGPSVRIDLKKIEDNTRAVVSLCRKYGIEVAGVTKVTCGMPQIAKAMIRGGVTAIGESRLANIHRLRASGINSTIILLRIPPLSAVDEIVTSVDISLNSELPVIKALSDAAEKHDIIHKIILMIDLGDLREGIWPDDLLPTAEQIVRLPAVKIEGIGTNLTCYGGVIPTKENMGKLADYAELLERTFNLKLKYISGGNSSSLPLLASGRMPERINHLRIGEAILLGRETIHRSAWPGTTQDAFLLSAEIIELKEKPSQPIGATGEDAFGRHRKFRDTGMRMRAILNVGREDTVVEGLSPAEKGITILGASSDHLLLDVTDAEIPLKLGDRAHFQPSYAALLAAMTSEYVVKELIVDRSIQRTEPKGIWIDGEPEIVKMFSQAGLGKSLKNLKYSIASHIGTSPRNNIKEHNLTQHNSTIREVALRTREQCSKGYMPLILGGSHRMTLAALIAQAFNTEAFGLLWFDSHACFIPPDLKKHYPKSRSALSTALGYSRVPWFPELRYRLSPENTVIIGVQEAEPEEVVLLKKGRIKTFTMEDIDNLGIKEVMHKGLIRAASGTYGIHVSFSPSVVDRLVSEESAGGLTLREIYLAMEMISNSGLLCSMDAVGFDKIRKQSNSNRHLIERIINIILSAFGKKILGE